MGELSRSCGFSKTLGFRKENISDSALCEAVARAEAGLIDADLGGGLLKQRVARSGAGKSGGYRTLIFFRVETRAVFKKAAKLVLALSDEQMDAE